MHKKLRARKVRKEQSTKDMLKHLAEVVQHDENFSLKILSETGDLARMLKDEREKREILEKVIDVLDGTIKILVKRIESLEKKDK
ncbi:MAG: hypothetical protein E2O29_01620 [Deltaproteobacteria bacterium]|nr:MAG: hypothetical protein E2O29_01620 [Deltaproteobacteria bacterium]